jgi:phosphate transport system protein
MERQSETELRALQEKLLRMGSLAERTVHDALAALLQRDDAMVAAVRERDTLIDRLEMEVDELAIHLLSKAPLASDLRLITVAMKVSQNLERIGDEATKIARRARDLNDEPPLQAGLDWQGITRATLDMLKAALDAFTHRDSTTARELIARDQAVNAMNKQIHHQLTALMMEQREAIPRCLHYMVVSKSLERIADHATNIAEEVVYLREAQDIRHSKHQPEVVAS